MRIKKLAGGGLPAFVSYVNVELALPAYAGIGSSSSASADSTSSSSKSSSKSSSGSSGDIGLLNKEMLKILMENGLPSDVNYFLSKVDVFGTSIDPLDPHSLERIYSKLLSVLPEIKQNKAEYDDAIKHAREKGTLNEYAVTSDGRTYVMSQDGKITLKNPLQALKDGDLRLTNSQLLQMRAYQLPMDKGDLTSVVASSINIHDIEESIGKILDHIGKITQSTEGYVRKDSKTLQLADGYQKLIEQGEDGVYKISEKTITLDLNVKALLTYLYKSLSHQEKGVLANRAAEYGKSGEEGVQEMLALMIQGRLEETHETKVSFDNQATKGATDKDGNPVSGKSLDSMQSSPALDFFIGNGKEESFTMKNGIGTLYLLGNVASVSKNSGEPLGVTTLDLISSSQFAPGLEMGLASFGNARIDAVKQSKIVVDSNRIVGLDLPIDTEAYTKGIIKPDFDLLKKVGEVQRLVRLNGETDPNKINQMYQSAGLPPIYSGTDTNGNPIISPQYRRFAALDAYADRGILPDGIEFDGTVEKVDDESTQNSITSILKNHDKNFKESRTGFLFWTSPDLYKGTVFIPIRNNAVNYSAGVRHTVAQSNLMQSAEYMKNQDKLYNNLGITMNY